MRKRSRDKYKPKWHLYMKIDNLILASIVGICLPLAIQPAWSFPAKGDVMPIWMGAAPGSEDWTQKEQSYTQTYKNPLAPLQEERLEMVRNVVAPTLTVFRPEHPNGTGIIICPGGRWHILSWEAEGTDVARWLSAKGITAFVLKYRLVRMPENQQQFETALRDWSETIMPPAGSKPGEIRALPYDNDSKLTKVISLSVADGRQAIKFVREHAANWKINPDKIGMIGFSAGAFITMAATVSPDVESRPDFAAPIYGGEIDSHAIPTDAPPLFIVAAMDDPLGRERNSRTLFRQWLETNNSAELHIFAKGGHGFGMKKQNLPVDHWIDLLDYWLKSDGWLAQTGTNEK